MELASDIAPPVVAVMVVHEPGPWFSQVLDGLARQDYPNLKSLFLVVGDAGDLPEQIRVAVANAFVRRVDGNPGYGIVANEVLHLVEGVNGFFCFLHDDVALEADAIRLLVEELYRSNAGIVGPKLVEWDAPTVLQHVGLGVDRFGEIDPIVERGELDQEQHDAVRDVFALPSACLLVRADLFHTLVGFDRSISFHGEDLDLCWRAHLGGARVVVVPSARARHREQLIERRPDLPHETLRARHRLRVVTTLSGAGRLPTLSVQLVLLTIAEFVVGFFTGTGRAGLAGMGALIGLIPRAPSIIARRRAVAAGRSVPDREVVGLQIRGIARLTTYARSRDQRTLVLAHEQRSWRERAGASGATAWIVLLLALAVGSRQLIADGVPAFGQFLPFGESPRRMLRLATSGWWGHGGGASVTAPTGMALVALSSVVTVFHMGLLHTVGVLGLLVVGPLGVWRLSTAFTTIRARIVTLAVYAAIPLPGQLISLGRWQALAVYAAVPWLVDGIRRIAGIAAGPLGDEGERVFAVALHTQLRLLASVTLVVAVTIAFSPGFLIVAPIVVVVVALATAVGGARWTAALEVLGAGLLACILAVLANLPWLVSLVGKGGWAAVVGMPVAADSGPSLRALASFDLGNLQGVVLSLALYLPVLVAPVLGRGWRFGWGVRAGLLVVVFGWLAFLNGRHRLPVRLPEPGILLAPVALGLAIAAGCVVAAFELDVKGGHFGWRQPLGLLGSFAVVIGVLPGVFALTSGRWETPQTTMIDLLGQLPDRSVDGDYRVLWVGDQRIVPAAGQSMRPGIAYALTDDRTLQVDDVWSTRPTTIDADIVTALDAIANGTTARAGRLLAPFSVRYIVIPVIDGASSTAANPLAIPAGLLDALGDQLDLGEVYSPPNVVVYENKAWIPARSVLTAEGAQASKLADPASLAQADVSGAVSVLPEADHLTPGTVGLPEGTLHVSVPFDDGWHLRSGETDLQGRPAFGATLAFDVPTAVQATLSFKTPASHTVVLWAQAAGWVILLLVAGGARPTGRRRRYSGTVGLAEPVLAFDDDDPAAPLDPILRPVDLDGVTS